MHPEPAIQWDVVLQLEGNRITDIGPVHSLRGELSIQGIRNEQGIRALGDVRIDSMHANEIQITGIRGPFSVEGDMLYLGGYAHAGGSQTGEQEAGEQNAGTSRGPAKAPRFADDCLTGRSTWTGRSSFRPAISMSG